MLGGLWQERNLVAGGALACAVVVLLLSLLLLPRFYRSSATILPDLEKNKLAGLNQLQGLASLAGLATGTTDLSRLYPAIATSDAVLHNVILQKYRTASFADSVDLIQVFKLDEGTPEKNLDEALKEMRGVLGVANDPKTSIVSLWVEMREPQLAADVLNAVIAQVDAFMRLKRTTSASEQARWIGERLTQVEPELRQAEEALKDFREKNRRVGDSPELLLRQERLIREVTIKSTITVELKKQLELAKIEEIRNVPIVSVLDAGTAPVKKFRPHYGINTMVAFGAALLILGAYVLRGRELIGQARQLVQEILSHRSGGHQ
jgi:uncharacterized protein involved in exopolysaccharide biosynthesis